MFKQINKFKIGIIVLLMLAFIRLGFIFVHPKNDLDVIRSVKVKRGDLTVTITATGSVNPQNRVEVKAPIGGRLEEVLVKEGENVKKGQILAWMSSTDRAALLDAARAQGQKAYEDWSVAYKAAPIVSPIDGMVIVQTLKGGQAITTTDPVLVLSDRLIVKAQVDETDLAGISLGQEAEIQLDAYPGKAIPGTVDHIYYESTLVNNVNVYAVDVLPKEMPAMFRSGMTANVTFIVSRRKGVLLVPAEAVAGWPREVPKPKGAEFAAYAKGFSGKLAPVAVTIGDTDGRAVEITSGLKEGQDVQIVRRKQETAGRNPFTPFGNQQSKKGRSQ